MLWHSNNIWDIFPKGLLIGIGYYVGIAAHINETSTQNPWNLVTCKLHCKMAFILSKKKKKKRNQISMLKTKTNQLRYICIYMVICQPCNSRVVLPVFNKRHLCQNLFLSLTTLVRPHSSPIFLFPPQHLMSREALKTEVSKTLVLPVVLSMCCKHCPCLLVRLPCWDAMQQKFICQMNGGCLRYGTDSWH